MNQFTKVYSKHKGKIFLCQICNKEFKSRQSFTYHTKVKHEDEKFKCGLCENNSFTQKSGLSNHMKSVHFQEKYSCSVCDHKSTTKHSLSKHIESIHQGNQKSICTLCNKSIKTYRMKVHIKLIHNEHPVKYNCNLCTFQTNQEIYLKHRERRTRRISIGSSSIV